MSKHKFKPGTKSEDDYFVYELVEREGLLGWKLKSKWGLKKFKCDSAYLGYPIVSLENTFNMYNLDTIDVSGMDVSNVVMMDGVFEYGSKLVEIDISAWDISNVRYMRAIFSNCDRLERVKLPQNMVLDS